MFHINKPKLLKEEKEKGVANVLYYEGQCLTCQNSPDRDNRASCPRADFFTVTVYVSRLGDIKQEKHLCSSWVLCSEITTCFKKNLAPEVGSNTTKNGFPPKRPKYMRD